MKVLRSQLIPLVFFAFVLGAVSDVGAQSHTVPPPRAPDSDGGSSSKKQRASGKNRKRKSSGSSSSSGDSRKESPRDPKDGKKKLDGGSRSRDDDRQRKRVRIRGGGSSDDSGAVASSTQNPHKVKLCGLFTLGGHLTITGKSLRETSSKYGGGVDAFLGVGLPDIPILIGGQIGFDFFDTKTERFTYDGIDTYWDLDRYAFWLLADMRLMPQKGFVRPHLDVLGGMWSHHVSIDQDELWDSDEHQSIGDSLTGAYGFGAGVYLVFPKKFHVGLSLLHLRGGGIKVPDTDDLTVDDGTLYYGEAETSSIHQWTLMLEIGGGM